MDTINVKLKKRKSKEYEICVYEDSYMFYDNLEFDVPVTDFADALILATDKMNDQREYRKSSGKLYARIYGEGLSEDGFQVNEEGKNDKLIEMIIKRRKIG
jgi:hypothetical protein